ncbi:MAG TPA: EamA family transporter [Candidatus Aquilonibacter sp.]|nr:EamA family transporter [Candidatus Aquilonibacter sp.]
MFSRLSHSTKVALAFASVYLFWGSTYLAIRVAGEHLPVPVVSASRSTVSTLIIIVVCLATRRSLRVPAGEWWKLIVVGLLFMSANNMLLTWGETMISSGFASLIVATLPIMVAILNGLLPGGDVMNRRAWAGTVLGMLGIAVLVWPSLERHRSAAGAHPLLGTVVVLGAAFCFAVGSVLSRRFRFQANTFVATGWEIGAAAIFNWIFALCAGSIPRAHWTLHGAEAIVYLSVFGSIFGLVAFTYLLQNVAVTKVATYAFVNPAIAVLLGVLLLGERMTKTEGAGMAIIIGAVAMVVYSRVQFGRKPLEAAAPGS